MTELVVLVDEDNNELGFADKATIHDMKTPLHRAFSCYVFNDKGEFLVSRRALSKKVWPGVWTNSVCGHPAPGEDFISAIKRRFMDELGMTAGNFDVLLPRYRYTAPPLDGIIENEFCPVFIAKLKTTSKINPAETEETKWMSWSDFVKEAEADNDGVYSWWCKDQLKQLKDHPLIKEYNLSK